MLFRAENRAEIWKVNRPNGLGRKKFAEEIVVAGRQPGNGVFSGKNGTSGQPAGFAQAIKSRHSHHQGYD
jgi:hypothetical protein